MGKKRGVALRLNRLPDWEIFLSRCGHASYNGKVDPFKRLNPKMRLKVESGVSVNHDTVAKIIAAVPEEVLRQYRSEGGFKKFFFEPAIDRDVEILSQVEAVLHHKDLISAEELGEAQKAFRAEHEGEFDPETTHILQLNLDSATQFRFASKPALVREQVIAWLQQHETESSYHAHPFKKIIKSWQDSIRAYTKKQLEEAKFNSIDWDLAETVFIQMDEQFILTLIVFKGLEKEPGRPLVLSMWNPHAAEETT